MRDNLSIIVTMLVFVILIVIFPLYNYFERQDDMSYNLVLKATTNFVDGVINCGYIDQEMYDKYIQQLAVTGNLYDIQLEAHKKTYTKDPYNLTSNTYVEQYNVDYNADIFDENTGALKNSNVKIDNKVLKNGVYYLNVGDQIFVKVKNSNTTMAGAIFNIIVPTSDTKRLSFNYGGIIKNNAWEKQDISNIFQNDIYIDMSIDLSATPGITPQLNGVPTYSLNEKTQVKYKIKVVNYAESEGTKIKNILKSKLKLTGFESQNILRPKTVTRISNTNEWIATFDFTTITNVEVFFGSDFYKTCRLELEAEAIQGLFYKNQAIIDDQTITVKTSNTQQETPKVFGPYASGSASVINNVELGSTIIYYVNYYDSNVLVNSTNFRDYITAIGFEYDSFTVTKESSYKRFKITFNNISGEIGSKFRIKVASEWTQYFDVNVGSTVKVPVLNSQEASLIFTSKMSYSSPGIYEFVVPVTGKYRLTVIGANGGGNTNYSTVRGSIGGKGGKTEGIINLTEGNKLYVVVGGAGKSTESDSANTGGFNGGGNGSKKTITNRYDQYSYGFGGGGATDIRLSDVSITTTNEYLNRRIIVAGGGGGADDIDVNDLFAMNAGASGRIR